MDFAVSEPIRDLTAAIRRFVDEEILPVERTVLERGFGAAGPEIERLRARLRGERFLALHMPKEWGGGGLSLLEFAPISEELGRSVIGHYVFNVPGARRRQHGAAPPPRHRRAEGALAAPARRAGEIRSCFSMTEPENAGSNPVRLGTTAAPRRRRLRHRRPQVVHQRRRRRRVRDRDGGDQPRRRQAARAREP